MTTIPSLRLDLRQLLANAEISAIPHSAMQLLEMSRDPRHGPEEFADVIGADMGLAGQVLRFANSSYFGFSRRIGSVRLAVALIGTRTIRNFAVWNAVYGIMRDPACDAFDLTGLWQDSLRRAIFARFVAARIKTSDGDVSEEAFTAALLQDVALPILVGSLSDFYRDLFAIRIETKRRISDIEHEAFGWDHAMAAGQLAKRWRLPTTFIDGLGRHTTPPNLTVRRHQWTGSDVLVAATAASALLPSLADTAWHEQTQFADIYAKLPLAERPQIDAVFAEIDEHFERFAPTIDLVTPRRSLRSFAQSDQASPDDDEPS